jgi:phosphinothricin acetyltransferase
MKKMKRRMLMIRLAVEADLPAILEIYRPYVENTTYTFEYDLPTMEAFTCRFQTITAKFPWLVWQEEGCVLGYAYGSTLFERAAYGWCAEVSIYLCPEAQGRGIGRKLYTALEKLLFLQGYRVLQALVTEENVGSLKFHEAMGYRTVATLPDCGMKFGRWLSVAYLEKRSEIGKIPSIMPTAFSSIVNSDRNIDKILEVLSLS